MAAMAMGALARLLRHVRKVARHRRGPCRPQGAGLSAGSPSSRRVVGDRGRLRLSSWLPIFWFRRWTASGRRRRRRRSRRLPSVAADHAGARRDQHLDGGGAHRGELVHGLEVPGGLQAQHLGHVGAQHDAVARWQDHARHCRGRSEASPRSTSIRRTPSRRKMSTSFDVLADEGRAFGQGELGEELGPWRDPRREGPPSRCARGRRRRPKTRR